MVPPSGELKRIEKGSVPPQNINTLIGVYSSVLKFSHKIKFTYK